MVTIQYVDLWVVEFLISGQSSLYFLLKRRTVILRIELFAQTLLSTSLSFCRADFYVWIPVNVSSAFQYKPVSTRKLRRRGNEPAPIIEKRRKPVSTTLQLLLDDREMDDDLKLINKSKLMTMKKSKKDFRNCLSGIK